MEKEQKDKRQAAVKCLAVLAVVVLLIGVGLGLGMGFLRDFRREKRLTRTDLPGFGYVKASDPDGALVAENHCTVENAVTVVDDKGRGWWVQAPGWSLQWVMTNSLGAWIDAHNIRTGVTESFYLGADADQFSICPQRVGENLRVDAMGKLHRFLKWTWQTSLWPEKNFREFADALTVKSIPREEVGQTVALGDSLNLRQDGTFCGQNLWVEDLPGEPYVILWYDPFLFEEEPRTTSYTSAAGLVWELQWFEPVAGEESHVYADYEGNLVEVILPGEETADSRQMLEQAEAVLDRISARGQDVSIY